MISCRSNKPLLYLNSAIDIMEENSIKKEKVDWEKLRKSAIEELKGKETIEDTHPIIENTLKKLRDNHSFLWTEKVNLMIEKLYGEFPDVESKVIDEQVAYLKIPAFMRNDSTSEKFAGLIQEKIKRLDSQKIKGWIIDLRKNTGGNMWPMYLGLSPFLGENISGYFLDSNKKYNEWSYSNNAVFEAKTKQLEIENSYHLKSRDYKIAVLIGTKTSSSGEAIAIAFKGFPKTQFFGKPTLGLTTGNSIYPLSDGTRLVLTTSIFLDRNKKSYTDTVSPDVLTDNPEQKAIDWLLE